MVQPLGYLGPVPGRRADGLVRDVRLRHGGHARRGDRRPAPACALGDPAGHFWPPGSPAACSSSAGLLASATRPTPRSARSPAGCPRSSRTCSGPGLGSLFLVAVVFAVTVCALAVHAARSGSSSPWPATTTCRLPASWPGFSTRRKRRSLRPLSRGSWRPSSSC